MDLRYKVNEAKTFFFDRPTVDQLHEDARRGLGRFGSYVRRTARTSLRKARRMRMSELSGEERRTWRIRENYARREGRPLPLLPYKASKPGEPPRMRLGLIKKFLFFSYDPQTRSVVIGPAILDRPTGAPEVLETGGTTTTYDGRTIHIAARPFMKPAFDKNISHLPRLLMGEK